MTRLAIYEPPCSVDKGDIPGFQEYRRQLNELLAAGRRGEAVTLFMRFVGAGLSGDPTSLPADAGAQLRQSPVWPVFESVAPTLAYDAATMGDSSVPTEQASEVMIPLLALAGGASPAWVQQATRAIADAAPHGRFAALEGQTHDVAAEVLAPVLSEFFTAK
jgi:hypothetical protein